MLKKLYFIETCLIIILCSNGKPSESMKSTSTTVSIYDRVNQEVSLFVELLDNYRNAQPEKVGELKGRFIGELGETFKRMIVAEDKADQRLKKEVSLEKDMKFFAKPLRILGVCSRIETLADDLYPELRPFHVGIAMAFEEILTSTDRKFVNRPCIKIFRDRVKNYGISDESFLDAVRSVYGSCSGKFADKMSAFDPQPLRYNDKEGIKEMLMYFDIIADEENVLAIQIVLEPFPRILSE